MGLITGLIGLPLSHPKFGKFGKFLNRLDYFPLCDTKVGIVYDILHLQKYPRLNHIVEKRYDSTKNLCTNNPKSFPVDDYTPVRHFNGAGDCDFRYLVEI